MREKFKDRVFQGDSWDTLNHIVQILEEYAAQGYTLTLRQVYYQLVAHDLIPHERSWSMAGGRWVHDAAGTTNAEPNYKWIGDIVSEGRLAGVIDWDRIEDRARETVTPTHWASAAEIAEACARQYRVDHWEGQPYHVEILVEKQALEGVLGPVAVRWDVPFTANKGYLSQSMVYRIAKRIERCSHEGQKVKLLYLGDHDPSGLDMDRDIEDRLTLFTLGVKAGRLDGQFGCLSLFFRPRRYGGSLDADSCFCLQTLEKQEDRFGGLGAGKNLGFNCAYGQPSRKCLHLWGRPHPSSRG